MRGALRLRQFLASKKLSQEEFAARAGVPGPQVSLWLSGRRRPNLDSAFKLELATGGAVKVRDWMKSPARAA